MFIFPHIFIFFLVLKTEEIDQKQVKDVQQMLDEMMIKTMKEVEDQPNEADSDLSGTEKIEEVVCKEEKESKEDVKSAEEKPENENVKEKPPKVKPSDSETDTDNIRVTT